MSDYPTFDATDDTRYDDVEVIDADLVEDDTDLDAPEPPRPAIQITDDGAGTESVGDVVVAYTETLPVSAAPAGETVSYTREQAQQLMDRIALQMLRVADDQKELHDLILQAWKGQAWIALGYEPGMAGWKRCCEEHFSADAVRMTAQQRTDLVLSFNPGEISNRALAATLGVNEKTIRKASRNGSREKPKKIVSADGKLRSASELSDAERRELDRKIFSMSQDEGMTQTDIADHLGMSQSTVSTAIRRETERRRDSGLEPIDIPDLSGVTAGEADRIDTAHAGLDRDAETWVRYTVQQLRQANASLAETIENMQDEHWVPGSLAVSRVLDRGPEGAGRDLEQILDGVCKIIRLIAPDVEELYGSEAEQDGMYDLFGQVRAAAEDAINA